MTDDVQRHARRGRENLHDVPHDAGPGHGHADVDRSDADAPAIGMGIGMWDGITCLVVLEAAAGAPGTGADRHGVDRHRGLRAGVGRERRWRRAT